MSVVLNDGTTHPMIGYGTYKVGVVPASASGATAAPVDADAINPATCVKQAIELGYRFLDCAEFYANEKSVGEGIAQSGVARSELYIVSKVWTTTIHAGPEAVQAQLEKSLADLGTTYLDLYLIHWPVPGGKHVEAYKQLEKAKAAGQIKSIGVSNYTVEDYKELMSSGVTVKPAVNQVEINPFMYRKQTIDFFVAEGVIMQSYRTLCNGKAFTDPTILGIAEKHSRTTAQILGRWCVQHGFIAIPKSVKTERMAENMKVFDFTLDEADMATLDGLTTPEAIAAYVELYRKCVVRDTPMCIDEARPADSITQG
eukprot:TRINITY_DN63713_c0_g1_i1.p2 TRINITY_DN63713_c0_g1~~TRINITY_DN63713_c0_g1_i1.p2  ORF type:complete len:313 (+),score=80.59 TRINITY_DN63713_c0_g1_i1:96-1034(+)